MRASEYVKQALVTESKEAYDDMFARLVSIDNRRLLHAAMGLSTEANEVLDIMKKGLFYGKPIDRDKLVEEACDCAWYIAVISDVTGVSITDMMARNIAKLKARYGDKFTPEKAINRDEKAEADAVGAYEKANGEPLFTKAEVEGV